MNQDKYKRKLAAIFMADVKGYSRLMGKDEEGTVRILIVYKGIMTDFIQHHRGRIVGSAGDSILAEFGSVVDAVRCAVEIQEELKDKNKELSEDGRMDFRIGVNLGDVVEEGDTIYGDGVNIAARLESIAPTGGVCISGTVYDQIKNKLAFGYEYQGEQSVKNIAERVRVYRVLLEPGVSVSQVAVEKKKPWRWWQKAALSLGFVLVVLLVGFEIRRLFWHPAAPPGEQIPKEKVISALPEAPSTTQPTSDKTASKEKLTPSLPGKPATPSTSAETPKQDVASRGNMKFPLPDKPSIAILPFVNMSGEKEQEYFSDGITEDLITDISKISGLLVISRSSTFVYKGKSVKISQISEELSVRYVLEGSVRKAGNLIRINVQLIDGTTDHHLWAERYDGNLDDIFSLQDKITQRVVLALELKLTAVEKALMARKGTANAEAYDAFLKGWEHYLRLKPDDLVKAAEYFKNALELDPDYGRAKAAMAWVYYQDAFFGKLVSREDCKDCFWVEARLRSRQWLKEALKQPSSLAHLLNSQFYFERRQHEEAISELERALALEPNDPTNILYMARAMNWIGKPLEAIDLTKRAMRLDPQNPAIYLTTIGIAQFSMGRLEEAATSCETGLGLNPELLGMNVLLAAIYGQLGREQEASAALESYRENLKKQLHRYYPFSLRNFMYSWPFKERLVADRMVEGLIKAGLPGKRSEYLHGSKENQLTGEEIRNMYFGSVISGTLRDDLNYTWSFEIGKEGQLIFRTTAPFDGWPFDYGKFWIEGDNGCLRFQERLWGLEVCFAAFRNANGTLERKNEYFQMSDFGTFTVSPMR